MPLRLPDKWLWDFWFAADGDDVHVFYLQAPRSLGDPELRHRNASIGHAVSRDLRDWTVLADALGRGAPGEFDDLATWTGSVLRHGGAWRMYYSGVSTAEDGAVQRIGLATSADLIAWERHGLVCEADPAHYETLADGVREQHWRDPWVEWDPGAGRFDMLVTARVARGPSDARGVIGHAVSYDGRRWEVRPPLSEPGELRQLEVPQRALIGGAWRIFFCACAADHGAARLARPGVRAEWGTHYLTAASRDGPYRLDRDDFLSGHPTGRHYAGRVLERDGRWLFFAWLMAGPDGAFGGELSDPLELSVRPDGSLALAGPGSGRATARRSGARSRAS